MNVKLWNTSERDEKFKQYNVIRAHNLTSVIDNYLNSPQILCKEVQPHNIEEWKYFYRMSKGGQSLDDFKEQAIALKKQLINEFDINLTIEENLNILYNRAIYETYDNYSFEIEVNERLKKYGIKLWDKNTRDSVCSSSRFKKSNRVFNNCNINHRKEIGSCMELINMCKPTSSLEWEKFYLKSGVQETKQLAIIAGAKNCVALSSKIKCTHGKDLPQLYKLAEKYCELLNDNLEKEQKPYTIEEAFNYIYIRAIDKTYIGYMREVSAELFLNNICKNLGLSVYGTSTEKDIRCGIDFEVYNKKRKLVCGIQVKGQVYQEAEKNSSKLINRATKITNQQHNRYREEHKVPIYWIYINKDYSINNQEIKNQLRSQVEQDNRKRINNSLER